MSTYIGNLSASALDDLAADLRSHVSPTEFPLVAYGGVCDGTTDDSDAWEAALTAAGVSGGVVTFAGISQLSRRLTVPRKASIRGTGSGHPLITNDRGSTIRCTHADAGLTINATGQIYEGFGIHANDIATAPMIVGTCPASSFIGVWVTNSAEDNWFLDNTQNCAFYNCESHRAARDNWVLTNAWWNQFFRGQANIGYRYDIRLDGTSTLNVFYGFIFENTSVAIPNRTTPVVYSTATGNTMVYSQATVGTGCVSTAPVIEVVGGSLTLEACDIRGGDGAPSAINGSSSAVISVDGGFVTGCTTALSATTANACTFRVMRPPSLGVGVTNYTNNLGVERVTAPLRSALELRPIGTSASDYVAYGLVSGEAGQRWRLFADGRLGIGDGSNFTFATGFRRASNGDFQVDMPATTNSLITGSAMKPGRFATGSRPSASTVGEGGMVYDTTLDIPIWSDGTNWRDAAGNIV